MTVATSCDVLGIDDMVVTVEGILSELDLHGLSVDLAASMKEAEHKLATVRYRLLLVDLRMASGGGDAEDEEDHSDADDRAGLSLLLKLRRGLLGPLNRDTPYAFVSAQAFRLDRFESELPEGTLELLRQGQLERFQKGQSIVRFVQRMREKLGSDRAEDGGA